MRTPPTRYQTTLVYDRAFKRNSCINTSQSYLDHQQCYTYPSHLDPFRSIHIEPLPSYHKLVHFHKHDGLLVQLRARIGRHRQQAEPPLQMNETCH